jgi:hypothetical protein
VLAAPVLGITVAGLAITYTALTGRAATDVLLSGEASLGPMLQGAAGYSVPALLLLLACKGIGYGRCLAGFRGGPVFPAIFLGAAGGVAMSHLPGLPLVAGVAMGIGAMGVVMLRLPMTAVLLATLLLFSDGLAVMPLVIVSVVVAHVMAARLSPPPPVIPAGRCLSDTPVPRGRHEKAWDDRPPDDPVVDGSRPRVAGGGRTRRVHDRRP